MRVLVIGAGKPLGARIALDLAAAGHSVTGTRRSSFEMDRDLVDAGILLAELDVRDRLAVREAAKAYDLAIMTPILSIAASAIPTLVEAGITRGVAFSSNNVAIAPEDEIYQALAESEAAVLAAAPDWAILRPTMIYGHPGDGNLAKLLSHTAKWPLLPVPGSGEAMQQPIHYEDVARIAVELAQGHSDLKGILPVGGPQVMSQMNVVTLACEITGSRCRLVKAPLSPLQKWAGSGLPSPFTTGQLARVELDKTAVSPADLPEDIQPKLQLRDGLRRLAEEMGLTQPHRSPEDAPPDGM